MNIVQRGVDPNLDDDERPLGTREQTLLERLADLERRVELLESQAGTS